MAIARSSPKRRSAALRSDPAGWGRRPVFLYGFDDLSRTQIELVRELARTTEVTIAVNYADRRALAVRAGLLARLAEELGADPPHELPFDPDYTSSAALRHLDRELFEPDAGTVAPDEGLALLESAGARGEAEAIGIEISRLLRRDYGPDEIAIVVRRPESSGPLLADVLADLGLPVALEASLPLASTCVGSSLTALCRAAADETAVEAMLAHLRCDPSLPAGAVDGVERRVRRGDAQTVDAATERWEHPPRHLASLREAPDGAARLRSLARSARELAEGAHRGRAPLAGRTGEGEATVPFSALELRAGVAAAELLERAGLGRCTSRMRGARPRRGAGSARIRVGTALAGAGFGADPDPESVAGPGRPRPGAVLRLAPGRRVPQLSPSGPAALRGAATGDRQPGPAPGRAGRPGALPLPLLCLATDRAPVPELAEQRRRRRGARPLALRRRGAGPARTRSRRSARAVPSVP